VVVGLFCRFFAVVWRVVKVDGGLWVGVDVLGTRVLLKLWGWGVLQVLR